MVILITGISSGFGRETARLLAEEGHTVYGTVRRKVEPLPGVHYLTLDVRDRQAAVEAVHQLTVKEGRIDVLVNNAGMGIGGPAEFATEDEVREQMETNFLGLVHLVTAVLPVMRSQGAGRIIALSSIGGLMGLPFQGFYSASKFAVEGYCEALRLETEPFGIKVVVVRPGDFSTNFTASRKKTRDSEAMRAYPAFAASMQKVEQDETGGLKPPVLARRISRIIRSRNPRHGYVVASFEQRLSVFLKRMLPARWFARILSGYYKLAVLLVLAVLTACCTRETVPGGVAAELQNPVLPGFHPDPSVVAVGEDYYLVNSTFHYFPGVPVYHSRDLQNWEQVGNVLDRPSQLPLEHATASLGIYAPTIRFNDGTFYMITTNVGGGGNFMVTATDPAGPWSEPVWLEQQGIDPSLYFEDGKCYMVSNPDATITLCEIDPVTGATLSPGKALWRGTGGRFPEGPHIYRKDGWYYLLISEGGTELAHKLTVARSRHIYGPYEANPANPVFTHCSLAAQDSNIQGTGHGDLFQAADGSWWIVFLAYRRYGGDFHHLGRETFLAPVTWEKGWPVVNGGMPVAERMTVRMPAVPEKPQPDNRHYDFATIGPEWMHIQHPVPENYLVQDGVLTLIGNGDGFDWGGWHPTALLRRQQAAECRFGTQVTLQGDGEAGLVIYQTHNGHVEFFVRREKGRAEAAVRVRLHSLLHEQAVTPLARPEAGLEVRADGEQYAFLLNGKAFARVDAKLLSTEMAGGFTGVTVGPYCCTGKASFRHFFISSQE